MIRITLTILLLITTLAAHQSVVAAQYAEDRGVVVNRQFQLVQAKQIDLNGVKTDLDSPPDGLLVRRDLGVLTAPGVTGQVIFKSDYMVWNPRATITPKGDYLVLFPSERGQWYQGKEMMALRSADKGRTWSSVSRCNLNTGECGLLQRPRHLPAGLPWQPC